MKIKVSRSIAFFSLFPPSCYLIVIIDSLVTMIESRPTALYSVFRGLGSLACQQRVMFTRLQQYRSPSLFSSLFPLNQTKGKKYSNKKMEKASERERERLKKMTSKKRKNNVRKVTKKKNEEGSILQWKNECLYFVRPK